MEINTGSRRVTGAETFREKTVSFIRRFNSNVFEMCDDLCVPVVDLYSAFGSAERDDKLDPRFAIGDNAHLNLDGQKRISEVMIAEYFDDQEEFQTVVCLGDSHTQGYPVRNDVSSNGFPVDLRKDDHHQFPYWMAKATGMIFINRGIAGNTFYGLSKRFDNEVIVHMPDHCIIQGGTNDALLGTPFDESCSDLRGIVERCIENEITPVVCTIIPLGF